MNNREDLKLLCKSALISILILRCIQLIIKAYKTYGDVVLIILFTLLVFILLTFMVYLLLKDSNEDWDW